MSSNRAFLYGDGLFETLRFQEQQIALWPYHYQRLKTGLAQLQMPLSSDSDTLRFWIEQQLPKHASALRLRLTAYRAGAGRYTPQRNRPAFQLDVEPYEAIAAQPAIVRGEVGLAPAHLALAYSPLSPLKSLNALPYVLAAAHKQSQGWEHILLCSTDGYLAEAEAYNLFWRKGTQVYTPSLKSACVAGVFRQWSLHVLQAEDYELSEGLYEVEELLGAEEIWLCNALQGIRSLTSWEGKPLEAKTAVLLQERYAGLYA